MLKLIYSGGDAALASRIMNDLRSAGYTVDDLRGGANGGTKTQTADDVLIVLVSPESNADASVQQTVIQALDNSQHVLPVRVKPVETPKLLDHLRSVDFTQGYQPEALDSEIQRLQSPDAPRPLRVLTPKVKRSNRTIGILLGLLVVFWFAAGIYGVAVLGLQAPQDEYNAVDTEVALTQAFFINPELDRYGQFLPQSSEAAGNYQATLGAVPTVYRPFMALTATSVSLGTPLATNDMSTPTPTPDSGE